MRILWGLLGLLITCAAMSLAYAGVLNAQATTATYPGEPAYSATIRSNLQKIYIALEQYASTNADDLPPRLSMLYPTYLSDPKVFWNPGDSDPCPTTIDNDEPNRPNSTQISLNYRPERWCDFPSVILLDNSLSNNADTGVYGIVDFRPRFFAVTTSPPAFCEPGRTDLQQLGVGLQNYAQTHSNQLPDRLSQLYPSNVSDLSAFWNATDTLNDNIPPTTIDNDIRDRRNSAQISYDYVAAGQPVSGDAGRIFLHDNSPANNGGAVLNLLTADMSLVTCIQTIACRDPLHCRMVAQQNLKSIINSLAAYATGNADDYPEHLSMLYRPIGVVSDPLTFWNPGDSDPAPLLIDNDGLNTVNSTQISYAYSGRGPNSDATTLILMDNSLANNGGEGLSILAADAGIDFVEKCSRSLPASETARDNLRKIAQSLQLYAADNNGHFPSKLSLLYPSYISNPSVFWNPGDAQAVPTAITNDLPDKANSAQVSYWYLGAAYTTACNPGTVLLVDNALRNNGGTGINVVTADYQVEYYAPSPPSLRYPVEYTSIAKSNLRAIGNALQQYAYWYLDEKLPPKLSMLYPNFIGRPTTFWHPNDADTWPLTISNDELNQPNSAQISFEFVTPGANLNTLDPNTVLVRDNTPANNNGNGTLALYADGHVDYIPIRTLTSLTVSAPATVAEGSTTAMTCTATYSDGVRRDTTPTSAWGWTSGETGGTFDVPGTYKAPSSVLVDTPVTIVTICFDEVGNYQRVETGITVLNTIRIPTALAITSGPATVAEGATGSYKCTVTYDDGGTKDVTASATWSVTSGPGSFPTAGTYAAPASVSANTPATIHVSYTAEGATVEAGKNITVQNIPRVLTSLAITSGPVTVAEGGTGAYTCVATFDDATTQTVTLAATWSVTSGPGSFSTAGTYAAPGTVLADTPVAIAASYTTGGVIKQATKNITVLNSVRVLTSLSIASGPVTVAEGGTGAYTCVATFDDATTQTVTSSATWSVTSGPGSFTVAGTYAAPATVLANTPATIAASYTTGGVTKQATKNITVQNSKRILSSIAISAGPDTVSEGGIGSFTCTAAYDDATTQNVTTAATWSVTGGPGAFSSAGTYAAPDGVVANVEVTILVSYAEGGVTREASDAFTLLNTRRTLTGIAISSLPTSVSEGGSAQYTCTASYDSGETQDVTSAATWLVTSGLGSFSTPGLYVAPSSVLADGSAMLSARFTENGVTKQVGKSIVIKNSVRRVTALAWTSGPTSIAEGGSGAYTCEATFDDGKTEDVTSLATWSITSGPGAFDTAGTFTAPASVLADTSVTILASYVSGGARKEITQNITVRNTVRVLASIAISSGPAVVGEGKSGKYQCTATYDDGTSASVTSAATWIVADGVGAFSTAGTYKAPASLDGSTTITIVARYTENGVTQEASKSVVVEDLTPPVVDTDADDDGVADDNDKCPQTPASATVDANGCAASQRDTDGDGVRDDADECGNTPAGSTVNAAGCPDRDGDGASDNADNCPDVANADQADADGDKTGDACDECPADAAKTSPGNCGCGQAETADCGQVRTYTVRVVDASGAAAPHTYNAGEWAEITAPAAPDGMRFSYWSGDYTGTGETVRILVDADKELVANYESCPVEAQPCGSGVAVCGASTLLALGLVKLRSRRTAYIVGR
jgi:hypothetical protein